MSNVIISSLVLGGCGFIFSLLLAFLNSKLKVEEDPKVKEILSALPGLNCGACGFSGCRPFAEAIIKQRNLFEGCLPGGEKVNKKIAAIAGLNPSVGSGQRRVVVCRCGAEGEEKKSTTSYIGPANCNAAHISGGVIDCKYGCLAFGDCVKVCPTDALTLKNKKIYVDIDKCIGCGHCVRVCPRKLFEFVPFPRPEEKERIYYTACNNPEKAKEVRAVCKRGCIGCTLCTKPKDSPFFMKGLLSYTDYQKANSHPPQEEAMKKCPTKCIFLNQSSKARVKLSIK